jgi:hypothetical protein
LDQVHVIKVRYALQLGAELHSRRAIQTQGGCAVVRVDLLQRRDVVTCSILCVDSDTRISPQRCDSVGDPRLNIHGESPG